MHRLVRKTYIAFACCLFAALQAQAQQTAPVQQAVPASAPAWQTARIHIKTQAKPLSDVVALLAHELHCNIVMDDAPIMPPPDLDCDGTGKEALDKVCDAYDYNWKVGRRGMILLTKRFRNPDEQPQMHLPELQQMAHDMLTALSGVNCDTRSQQWGYGCQALYESFNIRQLETLKLGGSVNFGDLNADQQATLTGMLLNHRFATIIRTCQDFVEWTDLIPASYLQARYTPLDLDWVVHRRDNTEKILRLKRFSP